MDADRFNAIVDRFDSIRVMVVGDIYLDENIYGTVTGVSLEAPVPIFEVQEKRHNPGAAGNAACNAAALGATTYMVGYVGYDTNADIVKHEFAVRKVNTDYIVTDDARPTNTYGKLRAGTFNAPAQEILRTDTPSAQPIAGATEEQIIANIQALAPKIDAIMVVDQVDSVVTERVIDAINIAADEHNLKTFGDSRSRAHIFKEFDAIVPNDREAGFAVGIDVIDEASLNQAGEKLLATSKNALVTRGPLGIRIFAADGSIHDVAIRPVTAVDVTGGGDTVTAAVALSVTSGASFEEAAEIGNLAAGIAVTQSGVVTVPLDTLRERFAASDVPDKLTSPEDLSRICEELRAQGKRIVWTNGCFDILHTGHITYLQRSARVGDILVLGINSDRSVRANKGPERPINDERERSIILSALACVDYIVVFDDDSPIELVKTLKPDVYAKGGDYTIDTIDQDERRAVEAYGGEIHIVPGVEGRSTTAVVSQIRS